MPTSKSKSRTYVRGFTGSGVVFGTTTAKVGRLNQRTTARLVVLTMTDCLGNTTLKSEVRPEETRLHLFLYGPFKERTKDKENSMFEFLNSPPVTPQMGFIFFLSLENLVRHIKYPVYKRTQSQICGRFK